MYSKYVRVYLKKKICMFISYLVLRLAVIFILGWIMKKLF